MRAFTPDYDIRIPRTLKETLSLMQENYRPLAGGTDIMVLFEAGILPAGKFLSLTHLKELKGIFVSKSHLLIKALTTYTDIREHSLIKNEFPLLAEAARETGAIAIQNRGTLGGNIANASPAADSPPALLVYGADIEILSVAGSRWLPYDSFHLGYKKTALQRDEIIGAIRLARSFNGWKQYYRKVGTRRAQAISKVVLAAAAKVKGKEVLDIRLALGSVAPTSLRAVQTEKFLTKKKISSSIIEKAKEILLSEISPIDDIRSNAVFRQRVSQNLLEEFLSLL
jgi:CO/xanthine dehydrogenase FAD-binding subunit